MADAVAQEEREKYQTMWADPRYSERSPGMRFLDDALQKLNIQPGASVVDLGCGTGRVAQALAEQGFDVTAVDIAPNAAAEFSGMFICACLWELPENFRHFDYGFCADVLEHIPTEKISDTLQNIARVADTVYFQIANFECHMGEEHGLHLHLTVKPIGWWLEALSQHFDFVEIEPHPKHHIAVCSNKID